MCKERGSFEAVYLLRGTSHASSKACKVLLVWSGLRLHGGYVCVQIVLPILRPATHELLSGCKPRPAPEASCPQSQARTCLVARQGSVAGNNLTWTRPYRRP